LLQTFDERIHEAAGEVYDGHVARQLEPFDSGIFCLLRKQSGLSQARLAASAGVSKKQIVSYEQARHSPTPTILKKLADALGTTPQTLSGVPSGEETLSDLRRFAGLDRVLAAKRLTSDLSHGAARVTTWKLQMVESGNEVLAWKDPAVLQQVIAAMSKHYAASLHVVRLAWFRALPQQAHLLRREDESVSAQGASAVDRGGAVGKMWGELNSRQHAYLIACFHADQAAQAVAAHQLSSSQNRARSQEWRKLPFSVKADPAFTGYTALQEELRRMGRHDAGAGATLHALERRGLIKLSQDQVAIAPFGFLPRTLVEMTRQGRACARFGLGENAPARNAGSMLPEWLWRSLVIVASCGKKGLPEGELWGKARFYLGTGYRPGGAMSRGFIVTEPVREGLGAESYVKEYRSILPSTLRPTVPATRSSRQTGSQRPQAQSRGAFQPNRCKLAASVGPAA
jgi:transcriptional regulator with XRE-family HTH domain